MDISILEEDQPRLLSFDSGKLDLIALPGALAERVLDGSALKREYARRGVVFHRDVASDMDAIGIRVTFLKNRMSELIKMSEAGQLMTCRTVRSGRTLRSNERHFRPRLRRRVQPGQAKAIMITGSESKRRCAS